MNACDDVSKEIVIKPTEVVEYKDRNVFFVFLFFFAKNG